MISGCFRKIKTDSVDVNTCEVMVTFNVQRDLHWGEARRKELLSTFDRGEKNLKAAIMYITLINVLRLKKRDRCIKKGSMGL